jgi:hypothetical protein
MNSQLKKALKTMAVRLIAMTSLGRETDVPNA